MIVKKSQNLRGVISIPPSKVHSFRALVLGALADGISVIRNPKLSTDWDEGVKAMRMFGATIKEIDKNIFEVIFAITY